MARARARRGPDDDLDGADRNGLVLRRARDSLRVFAVFTWHAYQVHAMHARMAAALDRVARGECRRLMIFAPPRHGKTHLTTWCFPAWYLGHHPDRRVICAAYSADLAAEAGARVRGYMSTPRYRAAFPHTAIIGGRATDVWETTAGGGYRAVGVNTGITGKGAHLLVIDDPIKGHAEADSPTYRRRLKNWWQWDAQSRIEPGGAVVIVVTRWHEDDLPGWLLAEHRDEWEVVCMPALDDAGVPLCPERYDAGALAEIKRTAGARAWSALYMQRPSPPEGAVFMRDWWRYHDDAEHAGLGVEPTPTVFDLVFQVWDPKLKDAAGDDASYAVGQVWGLRTVRLPAEQGKPARVVRRLYLLHQVREQRGLEWMLDQVGALLTAYPRTSAIVVEDAAIGPAAMELLRKRYAGRVRVIPVQPRGSKRQRAEAAAPAVREGEVYIPTLRRSPWIADYLDEHSDFRGADRDDADQVDTTTHAINFAANQVRPVATPGVDVIQANPWQ